MSQTMLNFLVVAVSTNTDETISSLFSEVVYNVTRVYCIYCTSTGNRLQYDVCVGLVRYCTFLAFCSFVIRPFAPWREHAIARRAWLARFAFMIRFRKMVATERPPRTTRATVWWGEPKRDDEILYKICYLGIDNLWSRETDREIIS